MLFGCCCLPPSTVLIWNLQVIIIIIKLFRLFFVCCASARAQTLFLLLHKQRTASFFKPAIQYLTRYRIQRNAICFNINLLALVISATHLYRLPFSLCPSLSLTWRSTRTQLISIHICIILFFFSQFGTYNGLYYHSENMLISYNLLPRCRALKIVGLSERLMTFLCFADINLNIDFDFW